MDTEQILKNSIKDHQATIDKAKRELGELEITYSIGDRFISPNKDKVILTKPAFMNHSSEVALVRLENGESWNFSFVVRNHKKITREEIGATIGCLVRYWDNRKKVHV